MSKLSGVTEMRVDKALLRFAEVGKLPKPRSHDISILRQWYRREHGGNNFFRDFDELDWAKSDDDSSDLVTPTTRSFDAISRVTAEKIVPFLYRKHLQRKVCGFCVEREYD